jgi:XapX domain-containing protein
MVGRTAASDELRSFAWLVPGRGLLQERQPVRCLAGCSEAYIDRSTTIKPYLVSLSVGILIGAIYSLMNVRSPAPPIIALAGLLGILVGEQAVPFAKKMYLRQVSDLALAPSRSEVDHVDPTKPDHPNSN